jgi:WD40 repeat protein
MMNSNESFRYWAFISYSHSDEREATWLHRRIERYRVPVARLGKGSDGQVLPQRLAPVFRDRTDLSAAADLPDKIREALKQSRFLIVICSPASAQSEWVGKEIVEFKRLGRKDVILSYIVKGEPPDVFPKPLIRGVDQSGNLTDEHAEPLAADARPSKDGGDAYLKLIAAMLGVGFDSLKQRETEFRNQRLRRILGVSVAITCLMVGLAIWAWYERGRAIANARETQFQIANVHWTQGFAERDERHDPIRAGWHFCLAAEALESAGAPESERSARLASQSEFLSISTITSFVFPSEPSLRMALVGHSEDGSRSLVGCEDGTLLLWDETQQKTVRSWKVGQDMRGVDISRDGSQVLSLGRDGRIRLWDVTRPETVQTWQHAPSVSRAVFSHDGTHVLSWSGSGIIRLWDVMRPVAVQTWQHDVSVNGATISHDGAAINRNGSHVLSWSNDGTIRLWDATKPEAIQTWHSKFGSTHCGAVFNQGGSRVLSWGGDDTVRLSDVIRPESVQILIHGRDHTDAKNGRDIPVSNVVTGAIFGPNESHVLSWSDSGIIRLWDITPPTLPNPAPRPLEERTEQPPRSDDTVGLRTVTQLDSLGTWNHGAPVNGAILSRDGSRLVSWSGDFFLGTGMVRYWDRTHPANDRVWKHEGFVWRAEFNRNESGVEIWSIPDGTIRLWDVMKPNALHSWKHDAAVNGAAFSHDESHVLSWSRDGTIRRWGVSQLQSVQTWKHDAAVNSALLTQSESRILSSSDDGTIRLWDVTRPDAVKAWNHGAPVRNAVFALSETRILSWSDNGTIRVWDVRQTGALQTWQHGNTDAKKRLQQKIEQIQKDESLDESGKSQQLWIVREEVRRWKGLRNAVFNRGESRVLSWNDDGTICLWDVTQTQAVQTWKHDAAVNGAVFSHDESHVLSWSADGTIRFWETTQPQAVQTWKHDGAVNGALLSSEQSHVWSWSADGTIRLWEMTQPQAIQTLSHDRAVGGAVFCRDESHALSWEKGKQLFGGVSTLHLWNRHQRQSIQTWLHNREIGGAIFNRDVSHVLSWEVNADSLMEEGKGSGPCDIRLWDVTQQHTIQTWNHDNNVNGATFSRDESRILSWSDDGTVRLWDSSVDASIPYSELRLEYEVRTATTMDTAGRLRVMAFNEWSRKQGELKKLRSARQALLPRRP